MPQRSAAVCTGASHSEHAVADETGVQRLVTGTAAGDERDLALLQHSPRVCEALFLARYIEKFGTGTLMMISLCRAHGLPEPVFEQQGGEFVVTVWRDWLTEAEMARLALNDRQRLALTEIKTRERLANADYQELAAISSKTAARDLDDLVARGVLVRVGMGRGTHYVLASKRDNKPDKNGTNETVGAALRTGAGTPKRDKNGTNGTKRRGESPAPSGVKGKPGSKRR